MAGGRKVEWKDEDVREGGGRKVSKESRRNRGDGRWGEGRREGKR